MKIRSYTRSCKFNKEVVETPLDNAGKVQPFRTSQKTCHGQQIFTELSGVKAVKATSTDQHLTMLGFYIRTHPALAFRQLCNDKTYQSINIK